MIEILTSTPLVSVQDHGRFGLRRLGVGTAGAMDGLAMSVANLMLGNRPNAAGIEITASPFKLRFASDTAFALSGADGGATLDGRPVPPWWTMPVRAGSELTLRPPRTGLRAYLALAGGLAVEPVLGSRSTDVKSCFGGLEGRALQVGDRLPLDGARHDAAARSFGVLPPFSALPVECRGATEGVTAVRVIPAAQYDGFTARSREAFWNSDWTLRPDSNRMGLRLAGEELVPETRQELLSHGILPGVIQVPPSGQPIIQACDANTCGGYPKMGVVIGADLWRLGQVRLGGKLRFVEVCWEEARSAILAQRDYLDRLARIVKLGQRPQLQPGGQPA